jgi:hypothetical protein
MSRPPVPTTTRLRAGVCGLLGLTAPGGALVALSPSPAVAAPDPCAASQIAKTVGVVATNTGRRWWRSRVTSTPTPRRATASGPLPGPAPYTAR